jgi:hypothetical protein
MDGLSAAQNAERETCRWPMERDRTAPDSAIGALVANTEQRDRTATR